jgi:hypothetical protein
MSSYDLNLQHLTPEPVDLTETMRPDVSRMILDSDVVLGVDWESGEERTFFGADVLQDLEHGSWQGSPPRAIRIWLSLDRDPERRLLCTVALVLKGSCDARPDEAVISDPYGPERNVRLLVPESGHRATIPMRELARGCRCVDNPEDVEEWYWAPPGRAVEPVAGRPGASFPDMCGRCADLEAVLGGVDPGEVKAAYGRLEPYGWTERPCRWLRRSLRRCYKRFTAGRALSRAQKRAVLAVVVKTLAHGLRLAACTAPDGISSKKAREVVAYVGHTLVAGYRTGDPPPAG